MWCQQIKRIQLDSTMGNLRYNCASNSALHGHTIQAACIWGRQQAFCPKVGEITETWFCKLNWTNIRLTLSRARSDERLRSSDLFSSESGVVWSCGVPLLSIPMASTSSMPSSLLSSSLYQCILLYIKISKQILPYIACWGGSSRDLDVQILASASLQWRRKEAEEENYLRPHALTCA